MQEQGLFEGSAHSAEPQENLWVPAAALCSGCCPAWERLGVGGRQRVPWLLCLGCALLLHPVPSAL